MTRWHATSDSGIYRWVDNGGGRTGDEETACLFPYSTLLGCNILKVCSS